ncbi:hypothetical protein [Geobacillus stearothermophilus]|uniref:hypothetical protein n=1 Tax=Geobacillus stearothermophilus TaxID=1422 RepID=UPI0019105912|nr:hypothetical protein [Geobacillus stearothermophilus]
MKHEQVYKELPAQTSQQILRLLDKNWKSFFKAIKDWIKNKEKYLGKPKLPKYKKKNGRNVVIFTNQQCKIKPESVTEVYQKCWETQSCRDFDSISNVHLLGEEPRVQYFVD